MRTPTVLLAAVGALFTAAPAGAHGPPPTAPSVADASTPATAPATAVAKPELVNAEQLVKQGEAYFYGRGAPQDYKQARKAYEKAAALKDPTAMRLLGEMQAAGQGGKKDKKQAVKTWIAAEAAGDTASLVLVADAAYEDITGQKDPKPGKFAFRGGIPTSQIDDAIAWYEAAEARDARPQVRQRSQDALYVLRALKQANVQVKKR